MTNALALRQALDLTGDIPSALRLWERSERAITDATQRYSRIYGRVGITWTDHMLDLRSAFVWLLGRSELFQRKANLAAHHYPTLTPDGGAALQPSAFE